MKFKDKEIKFSKELSELDKKVFRFVELLEESNASYVIVSGYIPILAGRSRGTEDIDLILEKKDRKEIEELVEKLLDSGYWCLNSKKSQVYDKLTDNISVRFAEKDEVIPNFEVRFPEDKYDRTALNKSIKAQIGSKKINISPLELQIAYKLYLSTEKDFEDALYLYQLFKEELNSGRLEKYSKELGEGEKLEELRKA